MRKALITLLAMAMIFMSCTTAFAQTYSSCWVQGANEQWTVKDKTGALLKNTWFCDDAAAGTEKNAWYLLDENGCMVTGGLIQDAEGNYYSLETEHNGYFGMMRYASGNYDGVDIVINSEHDGYFGRITDTASIARLTAKYGVKSVNISNTKVVYASAIKANAAKGRSSSGSSKKKSTNCFTKDGTYEAGQATIIVSENATKVEYLNLDGAGQDYTIETSADQILIINAPNDTVTHKGSAKEVIIIAIAGESYHGQAKVDAMTINAGHAELTKNVGELVIAADEDVALDIAKKTKVPTIEVSKNEEDGMGAEISIVDGGTVNKITSATGDINLEITETATKKPRLEFVGAEAVKAFRKRAIDRFNSGNLEGVIKVGGEEYDRWTLTGEVSEKETSVDMHPIFGKVFEDDVYVEGDFAKVAFINCEFKKNIYNSGEEMTMVFFAGENKFSDTTKCIFNNTGRTLDSVNDLISKFVFVGDKPIKVEAKNQNGAVLVVGALDAAILNGKTYQWKDIKYFVDEQAQGAIEEYTGQPINIMYAGQLLIWDEDLEKAAEKMIVLGELDPGSGPAIWPVDE